MLTCWFFYWFIIKVAGNQDRHKARLSSILGQIRPLIFELLALEWQKFHTFELEYLWSQLACLEQILCVAYWIQVSDCCPLGYLFVYPIPSLQRIAWHKWAPSWQNQQNGMCASWRLRSVWSESSLSAWRKLGSLSTHWAHIEDADQTGQMLYRWLGYKT